MELKTKILEAIKPKPKIELPPHVVIKKPERLVEIKPLKESETLQQIRQLSKTMDKAIELMDIVLIKRGIQDLSNLYKKVPKEEQPEVLELIRSLHEKLKEIIKESKR